ncbi:MAG: capsular biosynthesis protein [Candidatus Marinimicrobia bacterium]|nr:capsular biosynthesis protein [Candidatus Neomarinimicrobiota bacterium]
MKIALVCSSGGHLVELLFLIDAFKEHDIFFITYDTNEARNLPYKKYLLKSKDGTNPIGTNPLKMVKAFFTIGKIIAKGKPDIIISTGSEIAIPAFILAKVLGIRTVFIESWCRIHTKSGTGKIVYYFSDLFLVQWEPLLRKYGKKARYWGSVV